MNATTTFLVTIAGLVMYDWLKAKYRKWHNGGRLEFTFSCTVPGCNFEAESNDSAVLNATKNVHMSGHDRED